MQSESPVDDPFKPEPAQSGTASKTGGSTGWYNGYNWAERVEKLKVLQQRIADGMQPPATGPCDLCGDPGVAVEYHDEDYSKPYLWSPPAMLALCRHCHRSKLHTRFSNPIAWQAHVAHVRRGGYASDLTDPSRPEIKAEVHRLRAALKAGRSMPLASLRPYRGVLGKEWFAKLVTDPASLTARSSRPRP
jgi:hypothetical protein